jgi:hypothetical protein
VGKAWRPSPWADPANVRVHDHPSLKRPVARIQAAWQVLNSEHLPLNPGGFGGFLVPRMLILLPEFRQ